MRRVRAAGVPPKVARVYVPPKVAIVEGPCARSGMEDVVVTLLVELGM